MKSICLGKYKLKFNILSEFRFRFLLEGFLFGIFMLGKLILLGLFVCSLYFFRAEIVYADGSNLYAQSNNEVQKNSANSANGYVAQQDVNNQGTENDSLKKDLKEQKEFFKEMKDGVMDTNAKKILTNKGENSKSGISSITGDLKGYTRGITYWIALPFHSFMAFLLMLVSINLRKYWVASQGLWSIFLTLMIAFGMFCYLMVF